MQKWEEEREKDEEEDIKGEEIEWAVWSMDNRKTSGIDEIPNKVWKYGGKELEERTWITCNRVWIGEGWPEI